MADKENQQEQILSQTKSLYDKFAGNSDLTQGVEQTLNNVASNNLGGTVTGATKVAGAALQAPGTVIEKTGDFVGKAVNAPGVAIQKTTDLVGNVANAPGAIVQGAGNLFEKGYNAIGQTIGSGAEAVLGKGVGDAVKNSYKITGGVVKGAANVVGGVLKVPGELIKGVGHFTGEVLKLPGNLIQGASKLVGGVLKAPGEILKGIANGTENLMFKTKDGVPTLNGKEIPAKSPKDVIDALSKEGGEPSLLDKTKIGIALPNKNELDDRGIQFIYGNELNKMDNFARNMHTLANGKEGPDKPFSSILTKPKSERAAAIKEATVQLRSDLHKIKDRLEKNPGSFTPQQQAELKLMMKGIEQQGGIDKYMEKNFDLPENYQNKEKVNEVHEIAGNDGVAKDAKKAKEPKVLTPQEKLEDMKKDAQKSTDKAKNSMKKQIESVQKDTKDKTDAFKDKQSSSLEDKDVKPVISGNAPAMQDPTKSINGIGR